MNFSFYLNIVLMCRHAIHYVHDNISVVKTFCRTRNFENFTI